MNQVLTVSAGEHPKRLDLFLSGHTSGLSRAGVQRLIENGAVTVNGKRPKPSLKIRPGDQIVWDTPKPTPLEIEGEAIPLEVLFEDGSLLVLNKPAGIVVHPAPGHWRGTLVNALLHHLKEGGLSGIGGWERRWSPPTFGYRITGADGTATCQTPPRGGSKTYNN